MKKGFTLIEIIAILILLMLIVSITVPVVANVISNSKEKLYNDQVSLIIDGAKTYMMENEVTSNTCISLETLSNGHYIDAEIKDPRTDLLMNGSVVATYDEIYKSFDLVYQEQGCA